LQWALFKAPLLFSAGVRPEPSGIWGPGGLSCHLRHPGRFSGMAPPPGPGFLLPGVSRVSSILNGWFITDLCCF